MKAGLILLLGLLCLSGCKGEPKSDAGAGTAQGEVLPGAAGVIPITGRASGSATCWSISNAGRAMCAASCTRLKAG